MLSTALFVLASVPLVAALALRRRLGHVGLAMMVLAATSVVATWLLACGSYDARKVLGTLMMPAGLVWLGLVALAWWLSARRAGAVAVAAWCLVAGYAAAGSPVVGRVLRTGLERPFVALDPLAGPGLDAVVVLGGGIGQDPAGRPVLGAAGDRVVLGARVLAHGRTAVLVTTGPVAEIGDRRVSVPELTASMWRELGVPAQSIVMVEGPRTTAQEMDAVAGLVAHRGWARLGLVTSGYHMRRALRLAHRRGLDPAPLPANLTGSEGRFEPRLLIPSGGGFAAVHDACWELVGLVATR